MLLPAIPSEVFSTDDALRHGLTQRQLEWAARTGRLHRLRSGIYCPEETWAGADPRERAVLGARAVARARRTDTPYAFSHVSAAALLELPVPQALADPVWLTVPHGAARRGRALVQQVAQLSAEDVIDVDGLPCTAPARALADCLRHMPAEEAVALCDAALRRGDVSEAELAAVLARCRWPRAAAATALLPLLDGRRESGLESRSAVVMHRHGIPAPRSQVRILDQRGVVIARVDFAWLDEGVVGEADGLVKYGESTARSVAEEKQREARLQALGLIVVRWTARHLHGEPPLLVEQLCAALQHGDGSRFRGRFA
jgi:very-short-patch-repair endonuclease